MLTYTQNDIHTNSLGMHKCSTFMKTSIHLMLVHSPFLHAISADCRQSPTEGLFAEVVQIVEIGHCPEYTHKYSPSLSFTKAYKHICTATDAHKHTNVHAACCYCHSLPSVVQTPPPRPLFGCHYFAMLISLLHFPISRSVARPFLLH